jgi:hypothetical protein
MTEKKNTVLFLFIDSLKDIGALHGISRLDIDHLAS